MKIDSHQHFWVYDAQQYPWIPKGSPLQRDWLPSDLTLLLERVGLEGCIAVQARQTVEESRSDTVEEQLAELSKHPKFVGVRHVVQDEPEPDFMLRPEFVRGIGKLKQ